MTTVIRSAVALMGALCLLTGCGEEDKSDDTGSPGTTELPTDTSSAWDCEQESDDPCIQAMCQVCVDTCGDQCVSMDIYPPEFKCEDGGGWWDVWDVCPDWSFDTGA